MATNGHDYSEPVVLPPNDLDMRTAEGNNNNDNNNNINANRLFVVWDHLLSAVYMITLFYQSRLLEFMLVLKAVLLFILLTYMHMRLSKMTANCLEHAIDAWPGDGILRVEFIRSFQSSHAEQTDAFNELFTLENSYKREYKLKRIKKNEEPAPLFNRFTKTNSPENKGEIDIEPSTGKLVDNTIRETNTINPNLFNYLSSKNYINVEDEKKKMFGSTTNTNHHSTSKSDFLTVEDSAQFCSTKFPNNSIRGVLEIDSSFQSISTKLPLINDQKGLKCTWDKYFGGSVDKFFLEYFFGYNELLMSSVKSLSVNEQEKGILRNVITGKYRRLTHWTDITSYIPSFFVMLIFVSMWSVLFAFMLKFFSDIKMPFYIILTVWVANRYQTKYGRCPLTQKHWPKWESIVIPKYLNDNTM
ncbi:membralin-like [Acyrthosiphon pisum]|uniref:Uncharacterized protein n=1 Tax=Acyrthosiphon pisum TaxID=7029 RepID=A0A8R1X429_ACYPI|nr:membralin-like [Acyrthosiphon pisum]|eukprot:XP_008180675.1 PREDICTED: membralin-like [Acyrthosiphon pisum]